MIGSTKGKENRNHIQHFYIKGGPVFLHQQIKINSKHWCASLSNNQTSNGNKLYTLLPSSQIAYTADEAIHFESLNFLGISLAVTED